MGSAKELMWELQQERFEAWAAEKYPEVEPDTPEWETIGQIYSDWQDFLAEQAVEKYEQEKFAASLDSVKQRSFHAHGELRKLCALLDNTQPEIVYRMSYVQAVTVLEAYLLYCARALLEHEWPLRRFLEAFYLCSDRVSKNDKQVARDMDLELFRPLARLYVSRMTFHNVKTIEKYFQAVLHIPPVWPLKSLGDIVQLRHDLVHRNGVDENDLPVIISPHHLQSALQKISDLVSAADISMHLETDLFGDWRDEENREITAGNLNLSLPGGYTR
ncbi:hypothetical protein ACRPH4_22880 (plasmid) [Pantoea allii]|uniref:hypothetical protein n=1 Tax=Pantoea allii TaxID=574096 RepID=UPI003D790DE6